MRLWRSYWLGLALTGLTVPAWALINPDFTPVDLVKQSAQIGELEFTVPGPDGKMPVKVLRTLKGDKLDGFASVTADEEMRTQLAGDAGDENSIGESVFRGKTTLRGAVFFGKASDKKEASPETAHVRIGKKWFGLEKKADGTWTVETAKMDLKAVWDGDPVMLARLVEQLQADPRTTVPSRPTGRWEKWEKIATLDGGATCLLGADLQDDGKITLLAGVTSGDRAYRREGKDFKEVTATLKLAGKSKAMTLGDFNGDGRVDLASWNGKELVVFQQSAGGTFETRAGSVEMGECLGLTALGLGNGKSGVLVATKRVPLLARLLQDGKVSLTPVTSDEAFKAVAGNMGAGQTCLTADFDGDGLADLVEVFGKGGVFHKGKGDGLFASPVACGDVYGFMGSSAGTTCDFDADGVLDIVLVGSEEGILIWRGTGDGKFELIIQTQEAAYSVKSQGIGVAVCDWNNDGRQDFVSFHGTSSAMPFYGRGFAAFGFEQEMDFAKIGSQFDVTSGQVSGLATDLNGDGWEDVAMVLKDGSLWVSYQAERGGAGLTLMAGLPIKEAGNSPVKVVAYDGKRCLGAWSVAVGGTPSWSGRPTPGPIKLNWRVGANPARERQVVTEEGPVRVWLGPDGLLEKSK